MLPSVRGACAWLEQVERISVIEARVLVFTRSGKNTFSPFLPFVFSGMKDLNNAFFHLNEKTPKIKGEMHSRMVALDFRRKLRISQ